MSFHTLSRDAVREYDRRAIEEFGIPGVVLMENAGRGVADVLTALRCQGPVAVCCGGGNNGGDGFVIARHLQRRGIPVTLHCWQPIDQWVGDAGVNAVVASRCNIETHIHTAADWATVFDKSLKLASWVVDALLGTGARGNPRPPLDQAIELMNDAPGSKLAVDIPSGLDCDTGDLGNPTFRADHTCTFVAAKPGLVDGNAAIHVGKLHIVDIGGPRQLFDEMVLGE